MKLIIPLWGKKFNFNINRPARLKKKRIQIFAARGIEVQRQEVATFKSEISLCGIQGLSVWLSVPGEK